MSLELLEFMNKKNIVWFRQDLRCEDNPALYHASEDGDILPIYILDDTNSEDRKMGEASRWWLHHSLTKLNEKLNNNLHVYIGDPVKILPKLIEELNIDGVYWNRCYESWRIERDSKIKQALTTGSVDVKSFNASLLWEPWKVLKKDGTPYRVFTPYYRRGCLAIEPPRIPLGAPLTISYLEQIENSTSLNDLNLLPEINWCEPIAKAWEIGEDAAQATLSEFLNNGIADYKEGRNFPSQQNVSRLSPYLHFGEISPHQVWHASNQFAQPDNNVDCFCSELGWREFSYYLLYHFPNLVTENMNKKFDYFPWKNDPNHLKKWQRGLTGYPIVDAGMRELWQTGYIHNRVRMVVGSFLVKNLLMDWRHGERWFWDCLVDADLSSNVASWQWVGGCGADAAPYFRIFNPVTQGQKFDPDGEYTKQYVPELNNLPKKYLYCPWEAPQEVLDEAGVELGVTYPKPIVDVKISRLEALEAFSILKTINT